MRKRPFYGRMETVARLGYYLTPVLHAMKNAVAWVYNLALGLGWGSRRFYRLFLVSTAAFWESSILRDGVERTYEACGELLVVQGVVTLWVVGVVLMEKIGDDVVLVRITRGSGRF